MAWGLDNLKDWIDGLRQTFSGGPSAGPGAVGNQSIQQAIVNPLKVGAEYSGVAQGYRGAKPNASVKDQGLALLALAGFLGGQEAAAGLGKAVNKATQPKYAYGLHISPRAGLKSIDATPEMGRYRDNIGGMNYFFDTKKMDKRVISEMQKYLDYNIQQGAKYGTPGVSVYQTRTPLKGVHWDRNINSYVDNIMDKRPRMPESVEEAMPIWENSGSYDTRNFDMPTMSNFAEMDRGARNTQNPLEILKEFRIGENFPRPKNEDIYIRSNDMWKREDFIKALTEINKKQPKGNKHNMSWIKQTAKEYDEWWKNLNPDTKQEFLRLKRADFNDKIKEVPIYKKKKATP